MKTNQETEPPLQRILVPVDFSAPSRQALAAAVALSRRFGAQLAVLHVTRGAQPDSPGAAPPAGAGAARGAGRAGLEEFLARELPGGMQPERLVVDGVPFREISRAARSWKADLIVIATQGFTGLTTALLGSTAERVVRHAPCPVLAVRERRHRGVTTAFAPDQLRAVLVPVDFSAPSLAALPQALAFARTYQAPLTLLHVLEPSHADLLLDTTQIQRDARMAAHERLTQLADATKKAWPRTGRELRAGHPVVTITALAKRTNADLIVLGTHGYQGFKRALLGSVAERVVRHAPCSVLIVRA